jgi:hypothetical protein
MVGWVTFITKERNNLQGGWKTIYMARLGFMAGSGKKGRGGDSGGSLSQDFGKDIGGRLIGLDAHRTGELFLQSGASSRTRPGSLVGRISVFAFGFIFYLRFYSSEKKLIKA